MNRNLNQVALQAVLDRSAIEDTLMRYARGVDNQNLDLVASCFTADVQAIYNGVVLEPGVDAILQSARVASQYAATTHFIGNVSIDVQGDEAIVESYVIVAMAQEPRDAKSLLKVRGARNKDRLVRHGDKWLIRRRVLEVLWVFETASLPTGLQGSAVSASGVQ